MRNPHPWSSRTRYIGVLVAASVIVLPATAHASAEAALPSGRSVPPTHLHSKVPLHLSDGATEGTCFSNLADRSGVVVQVQNYEEKYDNYDSMGADDVVLTADCLVSSLFVPGYYFNGTGPADSETVVVYADEGGKPGAVINTQTVVGTEEAASFTIPLSPFVLEAGVKYWISMELNMDFDVAGQWGWEVVYTQDGDPALWQNPGDGFGSGCTTWANMQFTCFGGFPSGPDFAFELSGSQGRQPLAAPSASRP